MLSLRRGRGGRPRRRGPVEDGGIYGHVAISANASAPMMNTICDAAWPPRVNGRARRRCTSVRPEGSRVARNKGGVAGGQRHHREPMKRRRRGARAARCGGTATGARRTSVEPERLAARPAAQVPEVDGIERAAEEADATCVALHHRRRRIEPGPVSGRSVHAVPGRRVARGDRLPTASSSGATPSPVTAETGRRQPEPSTWVHQPLEPLGLVERVDLVRRDDHRLVRRAGRRSRRVPERARARAG